MYKSIDHVHVMNDYDEFLGLPGALRSTFPWSKEPVRVDRRFWESLVCLDPRKKGWLMDEVRVIVILSMFSGCWLIKDVLRLFFQQHIDLWVEYMLQFRPDDADWTMVTAYFVQLLLQDSIPVWYANGEKYKMTWGDVEHVISVFHLIIKLHIFILCLINPKTFYFFAGLFACQ